MKLKSILIVIGATLIFTAILVACRAAPTAAPQEPTAVETPPPTSVLETPFLADWEKSGHANALNYPFRHWDEEDPAEVPTYCAKCHTSAGYQDFLGVDGSAANKVDAAVPAAESQGIQCVTCHNSVTVSRTTVTFPSGATITAGADARCMDCHQGLESKISVDAQIELFSAADHPDTVVAPVKDNQGNDQAFGFNGIHYYAAAATLYGNKALGGYQYDGMAYDSKNDHVPGYDTCIGCHDSHTLEVKVRECSVCHPSASAVEDLKSIRMVSSLSDYDGDGDTREGMYYEIQGLQRILYAQMQAYAAQTVGTGLLYDDHSYPYFFKDINSNGEIDEREAIFPNAFTSWTPRLLKAAYNYQVSLKDTGAFAHGNKYVVQLLYDSIADLGGDVVKLARTDAGHFAGNTEPFRHWDGEAEGRGVVPYTCAKCHTAEGLPQFIQNGGTTVVAANGTTQIVGLGALPASNGFQCSTCHNEASFPDRYAINSVTFPSGKTVSYGGKDADGKYLPDDSNLCIACHQGLESTTSVNNALRGKDLDTVDPKIRFKNIHYFAAGSTLFGVDAQGAYLYEGKQYVGEFMHAKPDGRVNKCQDCHDVHALEPKIKACETCHGVSNPALIRESDADYDGDSDVQEGISGEISTLAEALYAQMQTYSETHGGLLVYNGNAYPYFFDANGKGYAAWTPRLMRAAFNYQYVQKDPGAYVHNAKFVIQFLIDSIEDLGGNVSAYARP